MMTKYIIQKKYQQLKHCLDERSRRLWCASEALAIGKNGVGIVHAATQISRPTIYAGMKEITHCHKMEGRIRKKGGGAKPMLNKKLEILPALENLIERASTSDREGLLKWTTLTLKKMSSDLEKLGFYACHSTLADLLKQGDYSLQLNNKEGKSMTDRNAQFEYINEQVRTFQKEGEPVLAVVLKKKKLDDNLKYQIEEVVNINDEEGNVIPYDIYDIGLNKGWMGINVTTETAKFAINAIRSWWDEIGKKIYKNAKKLMVTAACGDSVNKIWKGELQKLAQEINVDIYVCHFPPGTTKWTHIQSKFFSYITQDWKGIPLISQEAIVQCIGKVNRMDIKAQIDFRDYRKKVSEKENKSLGEWNYIVNRY